MDAAYTKTRKARTAAAEQLRKNATKKKTSPKTAAATKTEANAEPSGAD